MFRLRMEGVPGNHMYRANGKRGYMKGLRSCNRLDKFDLPADMSRQVRRQLERNGVIYG